MSRRAAGLVLAGLAGLVATAGPAAAVADCQSAVVDGQTVMVCWLVEPETSVGTGGVLVDGWYHVAFCVYEPGQGCRQPPIQSLGPTGVTLGGGVGVWVAGRRVVGTP